MGNIGPSRQRYDVLPTGRDPHGDREPTALRDGTQARPSSPPERRRTPAGDRSR